MSDTTTTTKVGPSEVREARHIASDLVRLPGSPTVLVDGKWRTVLDIFDDLEELTAHYVGDLEGSDAQQRIGEIFTKDEAAQLTKALGTPQLNVAVRYLKEEKSVNDDLEDAWHVFRAVEPVSVLVYHRPVSRPGLAVDIDPDELSRLAKIPNLPTPLVSHPTDAPWGDLDLESLLGQSWDGDGTFRETGDAEGIQHDNTRRAGFALIALAAYCAEVGTDEESAISDLLGDLRHLCDALGENFNDALGRSAMHYNAEIRGAL